jgi:dihydroorotase-like cyclic amidohydrolase
MGPFERLVIRGATLINGDGGMPVGPVDIVIEDNRIEAVKVVGAPGVPIDDERRPEAGVHEIDASGMYVMPGFIDNHVHTGGVPKAPEAEYAYKLWLAHGITTVRGVPFGPLEWSISEKQRSESNAIVAPRMVSYHRMGSGEA